MINVELPDWTEGSTTPITLTWYQEDNTAQDLTGATITARLERAGETVRDVPTGEFTIVTPASGVFRWDLTADDVNEPGRHRVQFVATFDGSAARSFVATWRIYESI